MRTVDYSDVLRGSLALAGILLTDIDAGGAEFVQMRGFHDRRLRLAWEIHRWPELCRYEQRSFRPPYNSATAYAAGAEVLDIPTLNYFQLLTVEHPAVVVTAGAVLTDYNGSFTYSATGWAGAGYYKGGVTTSGIAIIVTDRGWDIVAYVDGSHAYTATVLAGPWTATEGDNPPPTTTLYPPAPTTAGVVNSESWALCQAQYAGVTTWAANTVYALESQVNNPADGLNYQCHTAHTSTDSFDATKFGLLTPFQRYVAYEQTDINGAALTPIAEVLFAGDRDPRITTKRCGYPFLVTSDGFAFTQLRHTPAYVWLHYRLRRPTLTGDLFDATRVYTSGRQVYYVNSTTGIGNFYNCTATTSAGESPETTPAKWAVVTLPYIFREYLVQGGYADWLTSDGQGDKAAAIEGMAGALLELEADKLQRQQGQVNRLNWRS